MKKYQVSFIMDGISDRFSIDVIIESNHDLNTTTSELVRAVHSAEFFTANRDPGSYASKNPGRVAIRTDRIIDIIVRECQ